MIFSSLCISFWMYCFCTSSHQTALSLGWLQYELQECLATPVDLTKTSCVCVHVSFSRSRLLIYTYSTPPPLQNMQKPPKPSWKKNIIDNYKCLWHINLVGCFPQGPFVSNTRCSCRGGQRRGDGTRALCEAGCYQSFGLWDPHSQKVRLSSSAAVVSRKSDAEVQIYLFTQLWVT